MNLFNIYTQIYHVTFFISFPLLLHTHMVIWFVANVRILYAKYPTPHIKSCRKLTSRLDRRCRAWLSAEGVCWVRTHPPCKLQALIIMSKVGFALQCPPFCLMINVKKNFRNMMRRPCRGIHLRQNIIRDGNRPLKFPWPAIKYPL